eukprot:TRINITY_DN23655_c0_g1_i1.p1 TRINITY_DN23655_c0_g1~~TRINITY_DN23655_c0_g1_i1.p1  ORF type:complete len:239 (+),score=21.98 TRINITY_DN23655_c0_g1_i1:86-718(+)
MYIHNALLTLCTLSVGLSMPLPVSLLTGEWNLVIVESTYTGYSKDPVNVTMTIEQSEVFSDIIVGKLTSENDGALDGLHGMYIRLGTDPLTGSFHVEEELDPSTEDEEDPSELADTIFFNFDLSSHFQHYQSSGPYSGSSGKGTYTLSVSETSFVLHLQNDAKNRVTSWIATTASKESLPLSYIYSPVLIAAGSVLLFQLIQEMSWRRWI